MMAYDMSRYQRIIAVESDRVRGSFNVSGLSTDREVWITAQDITIWDEGHNWGRLLYSGDFTASVLNGEAKISEHMVASNKLDDVKDVWDEMHQVLVAVATEYWAQHPAGVTS